MKSLEFKLECVVLPNPMPKMMPELPKQLVDFGVFEKTVHIRLGDGPEIVIDKDIAKAILDKIAESKIPNPVLRMPINITDDQKRAIIESVGSFSTLSADAGYCACGVPDKLHGTCCGWQNAAIITEPKTNEEKFWMFKRLMWQDGPVVQPNLYQSVESPNQSV